MIGLILLAITPERVRHLAMGAPRVKDKVLEYLAKRPNVNIWRGDIAKDLGLTEAQVTACIGSAFRASGEAKEHIIVVESGRGWRWTDGLVPKVETPIKSKRVFVELADMPDGRLLIQEAEGTVWFATAVGK